METLEWVGYAWGRGRVLPKQCCWGGQRCLCAVRASATLAPPPVTVVLAPPWRPRVSHAKAAPAPSSAAHGTGLQLLKHICWSAYIAVLLQVCYISLSSAGVHALTSVLGLHQKLGTNMFHGLNIIKLNTILLFPNTFIISDKILVMLCTTLKKMLTWFRRAFC